MYNASRLDFFSQHSYDLNGVKLQFLKVNSRNLSRGNKRVWWGFLALFLLFGGKLFSWEPYIDELLHSFGVRDSIYFDYTNQIVYSFKTYRGQVVDTTQFFSEQDFYDHRVNEYIQDIITSTIAESLTTASERASQGLIPDIEIPMKFPKGIGFIGQGGKLRIEGKQDISLGLQDTRILGLPQVEGGLGSGFPQLDMDQHLMVKLTGTVGERIKVLVDHDSQRENKLKNKIKLTYTGDEDDIIHLIETGDTDYNVEGGQYLGFSQAGKKGLFGIKLGGQFGPVNFSAVATREQAKGEKKTIKPNAETRTDTIYAKDYQQFQFVWIGDTAKIKAIEVLLDDNNNFNNQGAIIGYAQFYDNYQHTPNPMYQEQGYFNYLIPDQDYFFYQIAGANILQLNNPLQDQQEILCVRYVTESGDTVGNFGDTTIVYGKILKPRSFDDSLYVFNPSPPPSGDSIQFSHYARNVLWNLWLKNIYNLHATNLTPRSVDIVIKKQTPGVDVDGENNKTYIQILKIDNNNDGKIDVQYPGVGTILDLNNGFLIFPSPYPFASSELEEPDSIIYLKPRRLMDPNEGTLYYLEVTTTSRPNIISLGALNIVEGSEVVTYNGRKLERGKDYTIDYENGILTILNEEVKSDPNAKLEITFDHSPFIALKQRSLFAARFESNWSKNFNIGTGLLLRTETTPDRRPQLGAEPTRLFFGELDWSIQQEIPLITRGIDRLPLISTDQPSSFRFTGVVKRNFPNINTVGAAYIDDMESNKKSIDLPVYRSKWIYGSIPVSTDGMDYDTSNYALKQVWASPVDMVKYGDVYPNAPEERKDDYLTVLYWEVIPKNPAPPNTWASLNHAMAGEDISKYDFLEVYVKGNGAVLHIDIGNKIPERSVWRDAAGKIRGVTDYDTLISGTGDTTLIPKVHNEDKNRDGILDVGEDTGLDLVSGNDSNWNPNSRDDGNDDYYFDPKKPHDFSRINGTEGNNVLDSDDLDKNGVIETGNLYFEYTINLDDPDDPSLVYKNPTTGWKYYRIPLKNSDFYNLVGGQEMWENIKYARIWVSGITRRDTIMIAKMEITGNRWVSKGVHTSDTLNPVGSEEKFGISTVNNQETPEYVVPPGVKLYRDPSTGQQERESSLSMIATNLRPGHSGYAQRDLVQKQDYLDYRAMEFWVRPAPGTSPPFPTIFLRLGSDTNNFYEFRYKIKSVHWTEVKIPLDSLAQFKKTVLDTAETPPMSPVYNGRFGFKGTPSLTDIRMLQFGIINDLAINLNFEVWVDELRLVDPRSGGGYAISTDFQSQFADLASVSLHFERRQPNFQNPNETVRSRESRTSYSLNSSLNLHKLFPRSWGISLPVNYSKTLSRSLPVFGTGSDVYLTPKQRLEEASTSWNENISVSFQKTGSSNRLLKWFIDPLNPRFDRMVSRSYDPLKIHKTFKNDFRLNYSYRPNIKPLKFLGQEFRYFLSNIGLTGTYTENYNYDSSLVANSVNLDHKKYYQFSGNFSMNPIRILTMSYRQSATNDKSLRPDILFGKEIRKSEDFNANLNFSFFDLISPSLNLSSSYTEDRSPEIQYLDSLEIRDIQAQKTASLSMSIDPLRFLKKIFPPYTSSPIPPQQPRDTTKSDTTRPEKPHGPTIRNRIGNFIQSLSRIFNPHNISGSISQNSRYYSALGRPPLSYRLGLSLDPQVSYLDTTRSNRTNTYNISHSTSIFFGFFNLSYSGSYSNSHSFTQQRNSYNENITLPNLSLSINGIQTKLRFLSKFTNSVSLTMTFNRTKTNQGDLGGPLISTSLNNSIQPSMSLQLKGGANMNISFNFSHNVSEDKLYNTGKTETQTKSFNLSLNQSMRNPKGFTLPFSNKIIFKLRSELNNRLNIDIEDSRSVNRGTIQTNQFKVVIDLNSTYQFTRSVTGGITFNFSNIKDRKTGRTTREWKLNANASFQF